jgi:hypothetical protein
LLHCPYYRKSNRWNWIHYAKFNVTIQVGGKADPNIFGINGLGIIIRWLGISGAWDGCYFAIGGRCAVFVIDYYPGPTVDGLNTKGITVYSVSK